MNTEQSPLFSLTIGEFIALTKELVNEAFKIKDAEESLNAKKEKDNDEHFNIKELAVFLHCSRVSIHNYKKKGLPFYRIGRKILFKRQEVLNFMKNIRSKHIVLALITACTNRHKNQRS